LKKYWKKPNLKILRYNYEIKWFENDPWKSACYTLINSNIKPYMLHCHIPSIWNDFVIVLTSAVTQYRDHTWPHSSSSLTCCSPAERKCKGITQHMLIRRHWRNSDVINTSASIVIASGSYWLSRESTCIWVWRHSSPQSFPHSGFSSDLFLKQKHLISWWLITIRSPWHFCGYYRRQPFYTIVFD